MSNVWEIVKREYLTRVKKKTFLLTTFLTPILIVVFGVILVLILGYQSNESPKILIKDDNGGLVTQADLDNSKLNAELSNKDLAVLRQQEDKDYVGVLYVPKIDSLLKRSHEVSYYSDDAIAPDIAMRLESMLSEKIRKRKIVALNYNEETIETLRTSIKMKTKALSDEEDAAGPLNSGIAAALGGIMGFIMYFAVSIYGSMVMRGVMEEKINRIVEVMVSSVKPFELMLGKVLGIGGVGLTQLLIWVIFFPLVSLLISFFYPMNPSDLQAMTEGLPNSDIQDTIMEFNSALSTIDWHIILPSFLIFFFGGYMLYAALFAAIGSAVGDDMGEAQSLQIPVVLPIIFGIYIMISAIRNPSSPLAVWSSMIPFFSPMVMPARLAFNPPMWQLLLSIALLILTVIGIIWLSGRIYRVGILMYGKKASFKELWRWLIKNN